MSKMWIYDGMIYIYALSLLCYFSDFAEKNRRARQYGTGLLVFVWILQTVFMVIRLIERSHLPLVNMFETLFLFSWLMVTVAFSFNLFSRTDLLVFFMNVLGFGVLALGLFTDPKASPTLSEWMIQDEVLFVHITLAIASYAAFSISAILSAVYLFLHFRLKGKKWSPSFSRLPGLGTIDKFAFRFVVIGTPLLILSLTLGVVWILAFHDFHLMLDPKVLNSFLVIAAYAFYLFQRLSFHAPGNKMAFWNLAAYGFVVVNFVLSNYISDFHQWIWM